MKVGYIRVSTVDQNTERQLAEIELDKIFTDKCSGKDRDRPALTECLQFVREGDVLYVHDFSRLARNTIDLVNTVKELRERGVAVHFVKENLNTEKDNPMSAFMLTVMGAVAQLERDNMLERQREGIAIAKAKGKFKGRQPVVNAAMIERIKKRLDQHATGVEIQRELGISSATYYRAKKVALGQEPMPEVWQR